MFKYFLSIIPLFIFLYNCYFISVYPDKDIKTFLPTPASPVNPVIKWQISIGGSEPDLAQDIVKNNDGSFLIAGFVDSNDGDITDADQYTDGWIVKLNSDYEIEWTKIFGTESYDYIYDIHFVRDNYIFIAGMSSIFYPGFSQGSEDTFIVTFDDITKELDFLKVYGGSDRDRGLATVNTEDAGYIVGGITYSNDGNVSNNYGKDTSDIWVIKLDSSCDLVWEKSYGGEEIEYLKGILKTSGNNYIIYGYTWSPGGVDDIPDSNGGGEYWIFEINPANGNIIWNKTYGGSQGDVCFKVIETSDGGYMAVGTTNSNDFDVSGNHGDKDIWVLKLDNSADMIWQKCYGGTKYEEPSGIIETDDNHYIITGSTYSNDGDIIGNHGKVDGIILKIDSSGNLIVLHTLGGSESDTFKGFVKDDNGGYVIAGHSNSDDGDLIKNNGMSDYWILGINDI